MVVGLLCTQDFKKGPNAATAIATEFQWIETTLSYATDFKVFAGEFAVFALEPVPVS